MAVVIGASQLPASRAADTLVTITSPIVTEVELERLRADFEQASAVAQEMEQRGLPYLAEIAGRTPAELLAELEDRAPGFSAGVSRYPEIEALADGVITNLEQRRDQFESTASLPGLGLTLRDAVWIELVLGLLLIGAGAAGVARPRRALAAAILGVGALLVAVPLILDHPEKTAETDAVLDSLRPFSAEKVEARATALATARDLFDGFTEEAVSYAASEAGRTAPEVAAELAEANPELSSSSLTEIAVILDRFGALVTFSERLQPLLVTADELSARTTMWILIGPGIALVLAGGAGLIATRRAA
ncbi:MAG: hypothetical protein ACR2G3_00595 [Solirubrobacterales bacterium]